MAKKEKSCDFAQEIRKLKTEPLGKLYLLYGEEDYLSEHYFEALRTVCLPDGDDGFSYKRLNGPGLDLISFSHALDIMPFLSERTLIELRNVDINRLADPEKTISLLSNIPAYCTVVFIQDANFEMDGRLKVIKFLKEKGSILAFLAQDQPALLNWIKRRFAAQNKTIDNDTAQHLVMISGTLMNRLIPEIDKIASYAKTERISRIDVDSVANHIPEADIFEMMNQISDKNFDSALHILAELLKNKDNSPFAILSILGLQLRRIYGVKLAMESRVGKKEMMEIFSIRFDFILERLMTSARKFSLAQLTHAIEDNVNVEFSLKSSSADGNELLKEIIVRMMIGDSHVKA